MAGRRGLVCIVTDVSGQSELRAELQRARARAEVLWRGAPLGLVEASPDGTVLAANEYFAHLLGYEREELVGRHASTLAAPQQAQQVTLDIQGLRHGSGYVTERLYLHKDGRTVPVLTTATPLHDADGQVERVAGLVVDLTEVHAQREQLHTALTEVARQRAFTAAVLETVDVGIVYVDGDGDGLTCNRAAREMGFLPPDHDGGRAEDTASLIDFVDRDGQVVEPQDYPLVRALRGEDTAPFEGQLGRRGGPVRDVVLRASRITADQADVVLGAVVGISDVTAERAAAAEIEAQRRALAEAQRLGRLGSFSVDTATGSWTMSDQLYELWGHPVARPTIDELRQQILGGGLDALQRAAADAFARGGRKVTTIRMRRAGDGQERHITSTVEVQLGQDGRPTSITGTHHDVTEITEAERQAHEGRAFFEAALAATPDFTFIRDLASGAVVYSTPGRDVLGIDRTLLQERGVEVVDDIVHPDDTAKIRALAVACGDLDDGEVMSVQVRARHADGSWRWMTRRVTPFLRDEDGQVLQVLCIARDVTELVENEQRLAHSALHDTLTGLPNRRLLGDRLSEALARSRDTQRDVAVLFIDLDGFKRINDGFGHADGDEVLKTTAERISSVLRPQDTVARVGGDEFVVVAEPTDRSGGNLQITYGGAFAVDLAQRIVTAVAEPVEVADRRHIVTASVGVRCVRAGSTAAADTAEQALRDADAAMYDAKGHGKNRFVVFQDGLRLGLERNRHVEQALRAALDGPAHLPAAGVGEAVP